MIKFPVRDNKTSNIEICGAALKALPLNLNRQLIKILEDLGVPPKAFLDLQANAIDDLRMTTKNPINSANFLQRKDIGKAARLPWLLRKVQAIGLQFDEDDFLRNALELAVLAELRELKHRARIPIKKGVTLYGCVLLCRFQDSC